MELGFVNYLKTAGYIQTDFYRPISLVNIDAKIIKI